MAKGGRKSMESLSRMQKELSQLRGAVIEMRKSAKLSSSSSSRKSSASTVKAVRRCRKSKRGSEDVPEAVVPEEAPPVLPEPKPDPNFDTLADIILRQANRIEEQKQELRQLKRHYERQVSTIKISAQMLELQLQKLLASAQRARKGGSKHTIRIGTHYLDIYGAVEELQGVAGGAVSQRLPSRFVRAGIA
ncbi:hypothetical protein KR009_000257 [Drosophila setifemur]|nr:hypothetical protein KR009_000257 [Drosophila setifemur]